MALEGTHRDDSVCFACGCSPPPRLEWLRGASYHPRNDRLRHAAEPGHPHHRERYRHALEDRDAGLLLALAHPQYFEDSGTPKADDDYGYEGLKDVLSKHLSAVRTIRYNIEYRKIEVSGSRARVDIRYDASFQLATEMGDRWERKQNDKRIELESDKGRWLIIGGM